MISVARKVPQTWAVARKAVQDILPMPLDTLKAMTWDMVCFEVPSSQMESVWKAVKALAFPCAATTPTSTRRG